MNFTRIAKKITGKKLASAVTAAALTAVLAAGAITASGSEGLSRTIAGTGSHGAADGSSAQFNLPGGVLGGSGGSIYVIDTYNNLIRRIDAGGSVRTMTGAVTATGDFGFPRGFHRDGAASEALFSRPASGVLCPRGRMYIADSANHSIRVITGGNVYTFAGGEAGHADGRVAEAQFNRPSAIARGSCGSLYIADALNHAVRRIDPAGNVTTVAGTPGVSGYADGAGDEAQFNGPMGIAVSPDGAVFVADTGNHLIRVIENGSVRTLAGTLVFPADTDMNGNGYDDFYIDDEPLGGFADGEAYAMFNLPMGLALHGETLIVADSANHRIRAVSPDGEVTTLAGTGYPDYSPDAFHMPRGVYVRGNELIIADSGNNMIRALPLSGN